MQSNTNFPLHGSQHKALLHKNKLSWKCSAQNLSVPISTSSRLTRFLNKSIIFIRSFRRINFLRHNSLAGKTDWKSSTEWGAHFRTLSHGLILEVVPSESWILNDEEVAIDKVIQHRSTTVSIAEKKYREVLPERWAHHRVRPRWTPVHPNCIPNPSRGKHLSGWRSTPLSLSLRPGRECKDPDEALERRKDTSEALWAKCQLCLSSPTTPFTCCKLWTAGFTLSSVHWATSSTYLHPSYITKGAVSAQWDRIKGQKSNWRRKTLTTICSPAAKWIKKSISCYSAVSTTAPPVP